MHFQKCAYNFVIHALTASSYCSFSFCRSYWHHELYSGEKKSSAKVRSSQLELDDDREDDTQKHQSIEAGFDASKNNETDENLQSKPLIKKRSASVDRASGKTMQSAAISAKTKTAQLKPKPNEKQKRPSEVIEIMEVVADPKGSGIANLSSSVCFQKRQKLNNQPNCIQN